MHQRLPRHEVVLLGAGHTHAHIIRMWRMHRIPRTRLTVISDFPQATYSGMLPAVLAGQYPPEAIEIDLYRLTAACGARLLINEVRNIDVDRRQVVFVDRPPLPFDVLSIGIGSRPTGLEQIRSASVLPIKPMQTFPDRFRTACLELPADDGSSLATITIVGGGVGGVEIAFCLPGMLNHLRRRARIRVLTAAESVAPGLRPKTAQRIEHQLVSRGIELVKNCRVVAAEDNQLRLENGETFESHLTIWATSATAPELLQDLPLPRDDRGFLWTDATLRCETDAPIFAVGDTGTLRENPTPKAGVYAVRQGPFLWHNLQATLQGTPLKEYRPQSDFLKLVNTGDGRAIGEYRGRSFAGAWVWKWKDRIDSRFMERHRNLAPVAMEQPDDASSGPRCLGCGGKAGGGMLSRVLDRIASADQPAHCAEASVISTAALPSTVQKQDTVQQRDTIQRDDAAVVDSPGSRLTLSTDFFAAPLDDPFLVGRIAALNSLSDLHAMGSVPRFALAIITLPEGPEHRMEQTLEEVLRGCLAEFTPRGVALVGGHTIEGPRLEVGFSLTGGEPARTSQSPATGDQLLVTGNLGTGVALAAHMQAAASWQAMQSTITSMLSPNDVALDLFRQVQPTAMTDITGFGLAGHLLELLESTSSTADISLAALPLIDGVEQLLSNGFESTMASQNRWIEPQLEIPESLRNSARLQALFDPQTNGGLLLTVPAERVSAARAVVESAHQSLTHIGVVTGTSTSAARIRING